MNPSQLLTEILDIMFSTKAMKGVVEEKKGHYSFRFQGGKVRGQINKEKSGRLTLSDIAFDYKRDMDSAQEREIKSSPSNPMATGKLFFKIVNIILLYFLKLKNKTTAIYSHSVDKHLTRMYKIITKKVEDYIPDYVYIPSSFFAKLKQYIFQNFEIEETSDLGGEDFIFLHKDFDKEFKNGPELT